MSHSLNVIAWLFFVAMRVSAKINLCACVCSCKMEQNGEGSWKVSSPHPIKRSCHSLKSQRSSIQFACRVCLSTPPPPPYCLGSVWGFICTIQRAFTADSSISWKPGPHESRPSVCRESRQPCLLLWKPALQFSGHFFCRLLLTAELQTQRHVAFAQKHVSCIHRWS